MGGKSSKVRGAASPGKIAAALRRRAKTASTPGQAAAFNRRAKIDRSITEGARVKISGRVTGQGRYGTVTGRQGNYATVQVGAKRRIYHESDLSFVRRG